MTLLRELLSELLLIDSRLVDSFELDVLRVEQDLLSFVLRRFLGAQEDVRALHRRQVLLLIALRLLHRGRVFLPERVLRLIVVEGAISAQAKQLIHEASRAILTRRH